MKGIKLTLGDGAEYVVAPLTLGALEDLQEKIEAVDGTMTAANISTIIDVTTASLKRNYPDMTREQVRDLVDVENMGDVFEACMDISGMKAKEAASASGE